MMKMNDISILKKLEAQLCKTASELANRPKYVSLKQLRSPTFIGMSDEKTLELCLTCVGYGSQKDGSLVDEVYFGNSSKGFIVAKRSYEVGALPQDRDSATFFLYDVFRKEMGKILVTGPFSDPKEYNADIFYNLDVVPAIFLKGNYVQLYDLLPSLYKLFESSLTDPVFLSRLNMSPEERKSRDEEEESEKRRQEEIFRSHDPVQRGRDAGLNIDV
jgi:hypothetical protein